MEVGDTFSLQYSATPSGPWQFYAPLTNLVVTNLAMTVQTPDLGVGSQFFRIVEGVWSPYVFPAYTNVPSGFSGQTYLTNPVLSIRPDWDPGVARSLTNGYLAFREGPAFPPQITDDDINSTMTRINGDLSYIIQTLGLRNHPSTQNPSHNYINYYLLGSGLSGDTNPTNNTPETGYQGWRFYNGVWYPTVMMTYQDFLPPDDYHRWAVTHEFVHVLQAGYGVFNDTPAGWFNESHNNYVMARVREHVTGTKVLGWLDPYALMGSYLPIECYAMYADGTPSGPGTSPNAVNGSYGGYCYSVLFPLFLSQHVGQFFNNALWEKATSSESVLQTVTRLLGTNQTKQILIEYGARNAILDFQDYSTSVNQLLKQQWNDTAGNWFYTATTNQSGWLTPSDPVRLPRHTGRNNIPITVTPGAGAIAVTFTPDARGSKNSVADLRAQLVYRATNGAAVFSQPVSSGIISLPLNPAPAKGVVILVITNVKLNGYASPASYGWDTTETFGYKVRIEAGGSPAAVTGKYF